MEFTVEFLRTLWTDLLYAGPLLIFLLVLIALIGYIIGRIEGWSISDSLYHAFINATTVGYGDFRPAKGHAKFLAIVLAFVGLVFLEAQGLRYAFLCCGSWIKRYRY